jgi:hypothetical protein
MLPHVPSKISINVLHHLCAYSYIAARAITSIESLKFDLATIEAATHKFSDDKKLGGGGFGVVYKVYIYVCVFSFFFSFIYNKINGKKINKFKGNRATSRFVK